MRALQGARTLEEALRIVCDAEFLRERARIGTAKVDAVVGNVFRRLRKEHP